ncbi:Golgi phosphoprotein 3 (GPP34) [Micromonospora pattaloongensis]|uniref:Golgi phosphoprotein 3 (GPP34) n=1 Tax=Micromonospora pattaloongensis TaxID=405436 RepID=A0A1H3PF95_9ACTN|nr:GPP34 family phosphoprotein [Micromonospora pattaloongensis]SDY99842.1 Golgi phosphoprotein 3 (GPP34) [Micromonospora pattaloongensis]
MRLADRFYLAAHHDVTGRPRLHARAMAYGLAAGLLAELLYARRILIDRGRLAVVDRTPPPDPLAHTVLDHLVTEAEHTGVRIWLDFLSHDAGERVGQRLWRQGLVRREESRRMWRTATVYVPADMNVAAWCWIKLATKIKRAEELTPEEVALAGLVVQTGLDAHVLAGAPRAARDYLHELTDAAWPPLRELLVQTGVAIGGGVLSSRT